MYIGWLLLLLAAADAAAIIVRMADLVAAAIAGTALAMVAAINISIHQVPGRRKFIARDISASAAFSRTCQELFYC